MGILVVLTAALMFWIAAWAFGIKSFDAFMLVVAAMVVAFAVRLISPFVKEQLGR
jgi:uncharacterized membrane protein YvlD (DUF360 family)